MGFVVLDAMLGAAEELVPEIMLELCVMEAWWETLGDD